MNMSVARPFLPFVLLLVACTAPPPVAKVEPAPATPEPAPAFAEDEAPAPSVPDPDWLNKVPPPREGRIFFTGIGRGPSRADRPAAQNAARQDARGTIASAVMSRVHSSLDDLVRTEELGDQSFFERFVSSRIQTDAQGAVWDLREESSHWDPGTGTAFVLVSVPEAVLKPTPASQQESWRRQAENLVAAGNLAAALPLARAACMVDPQERDAEVYLSILAQLERWREASEFGERWTTSRPDTGLARRLAATELDRYRKSAAELARLVDWDWFVRRLDAIRVRGDRPRALTATLPSGSFRQVDARGQASVLPLSVRAPSSCFLVIAWQDAEGIFFLYEHRRMEGERPLARKAWNDTIPLRAGGLLGDCAVWVFATEQPVVFPATEVLYEQLQQHDPDAAAAARGVVETLNSIVQAGGACVRIDFKLE